jgi:hypothetical protein
MKSSLTDIKKEHKALVTERKELFYKAEKEKNPVKKMVLTQKYQALDRIISHYFNGWQ